MIKKTVESYFFYSDGNLMSECEYLNGEKNGRCIEYNKNRLLKCEEEYLNGKKNGKCKEYSNDGKLIFEVEYLIGQKNMENAKNLIMKVD